jgi:molybdate/tungstate transport system permease protein
LTTGLAGLTWLALLAPLVPLVTRSSLANLLAAAKAPGAFQPLQVSLLASLVAVSGLLLGGTPLAWLLARRRGGTARLIEAGLLVPLMMPPLVIGLLLVFLVGPQSAIGALLDRVGLTASNTFTALVVASLYEAGPYYVLGARAAFSGVDHRLEESAWLAGHSPLDTFKRVTLPLSAPGLAMALATGWARAMGAFGAVIIIAYHPFGLPMQIWTTLEESGLPSALPYALILLVVALPLPLGAYAWAARRGATATWPVP